MIHQRHRRTDTQTTCDRKTEIRTIVHGAVKTDAVLSTCTPMQEAHSMIAWPWPLIC